MGKVIICAGGGGADVDVVTATSGDVINGKVIVGSDGEPVVGTMPNNPAQYGTLNCGQTFNLPYGFIHGGTISANSLASQTGGATATDGTVWSGRTYWRDGVLRTGTCPISGSANDGNVLSGFTYVKDGVLRTGTIPSYGQTYINPTNYQQTINTSGHYMTGNVICNPVSNLSPENIRKGVTVGGVTGTAEGYFADSTDLYYRGVNNAGFNNIDTSTTAINAKKVDTITSTVQYDFALYPNITIVCSGLSSSQATSVTCQYTIPKYTTTYVMGKTTATSTFTFTVPTQARMLSTIQIYFYCNSGSITQIYIS